MLSESHSIIKFLQMLNLDQFLTKPQFEHFMFFMFQMLSEKYHGKISDFEHAHRTSSGRFLNDSPWDDQLIKSVVQDYLIDWIYNHSRLTKKPIYVIIDDTTCMKTKPSSQAENPIENCDWHFSHLERRNVYGHQFVTVILRCGDVSFPFEILPYEKENQSKIQLAKEIIKRLPRPPHKGYVEADCWYTSKEMMNTAIEAGFIYLGAIKTNRIIFPKGNRPKGVQIKEFVKSLALKDLDLVTVENTQYFTYTYEGKLKSRHLVKIVMSWPKEAVFVSHALRCFISTETALSTKKLLNHYTKRWIVEIFFKNTKQKFGFGNYQLRSLKGIKRLMLIIQVLYIHLVRMEAAT